MSIRGSIIVVAVAATWLAMAGMQATGQTPGPLLAPTGRVAISQPAPAAMQAQGPAVATRPTRIPAGRSRLASRPAATLPASTQPAMLRVDAPKYDFGQVWDTDTVTHTYEVRNTGSRAVAITNVHTSCGCTTTDKWEKQVAPGEVWKLPVTFVAANRRGKTSKTITVDTDDPGARQVVLLLEGEIKLRFEISPAIAAFGNVRRDAQARKTVSITNNSDEAVTIQGVKVDTDLLKVGIREIEAGRKYELDIETVPPLTVNNFRSTITLETSLKEQPKVTVQATGTVPPRITLMPQMIMIPQAQDREQRRRLVLKATEEVTFHVTGTKVSNPKIGVTVDTVHEGSEYQIWVTVPAGVTLPTSGEILTITTDDTVMPMLTARLQAYMAGRFASSRGQAATMPAIDAAAGEAKAPLPVHSRPSAPPAQVQPGVE